MENMATIILNIKGNATNLPFDDNSFDVAISTHTQEHIVEATKAFEELCREL